MGIFSDLFGGATTSISKIEYALPLDDIKKLVSSVKINTLSKEEECVVEDAIDARRRGDGKISLFQIDEVLQKLEASRSISQYDRKHIFRIFKEYFEKNIK